MAVDASHPDCFQRRDGLYVLSDPTAQSRQQEAAYDEWDAKVASRLRMRGWGWYGVYTRVGTPVLLAVASYLLVTSALHAPWWLGLIVAIVLGLVGIPLGRSTARSERAHEYEDRLARSIRLAGPAPAKPAATRIPPVVAQHAPAGATSTQLLEWSQVIDDYEARLAQLPELKRQVSSPAFLGGGGFAPNGDVLMRFERDLVTRRPAYEAAMAELGADPRPEPPGL